MRFQQLLLLTGMSAARDPHRSRAQVAQTQGAPLLNDGVAQLHVELHIADDVRAGSRCADRNKTLGVLRSLRRDQRVARPYAAEQRAEAAIARYRSLREARAREYHGHAAP